MLKNKSIAIEVLRNLIRKVEREYEKNLKEAEELDFHDDEYRGGNEYRNGYEKWRSSHEKYQKKYQNNITKINQVIDLLND